MVIKYKNSNTKPQNPKRKWLIILLVALILVAVGVYLLFIRDTPATSGTIPATTSTKSAPSAATKESTNKTSTPTTSDEKSTENPTTTEAINLTSPPTGSFVSNHRPSLSGTTKPSSEQSTCNTTAGATCSIKFTNGDIVKTLPSQIANADGSVIWNWDVATAGLTEGSWKITAIAQANGKSFEAADSMNLEVQP